MSREILFKAKRKNWKELPKEDWWVEGYYIKMTLGTDIKPSDVIFVPFKISRNEEWGWMKIDPTTICQYTGLTDKNGWKIWENDIVNRTDLHVVSEPSIGFIEYDLENTSFLIHWTNKVEYSPTYHWKDKLQVIGNIFDNADLLEVKR